MLPSAVVEQQAKLGVSAEESKAQRLKRQQARFRDRGGVFVPSNSNPLVDILLARTVSGESPSKTRAKDVAAKRRSLPKARQASPTYNVGVSKQVQAIAGSSKSKPPASRKRKTKVVEPQAEVAPIPAPKRRGRPPKGKKKVPNSDTEQPPLVNTTSKGKGRQRNAASSTSNGKPKLKAKAKSKPAKEVVEVLVSDDDQTLVEVPRKSNSKRNTQHEDGGDLSDDPPLVRKRVAPHVDSSKASGTKTATRVKTEKVPSSGSSGKTVGYGEERPRDEKHSKRNAEKRLVPRDGDGNDDDDIAAPPTKKGKVASSTSAKPYNATDPDVRNGPNTIAKGKATGKGRAEPEQNVAGPVEEDDKQPPERVTKPKKRKKEEDNYDDRPRKTVKFSEPGPPHSSSQKLKENQSDGQQKSTTEPSDKDKRNGAHPKLATKPPSRTKASKGPPREVLERIRASAARHLRCTDSEPDELDCLS